MLVFIFSIALPPILLSRVFVEFERPHSHSRSLSADAPVLDAVLIALKRRQERNRLALYIDESPLPSQRNEDVPVIRAGALKEMKLPDSGTKQIVITEVLYKPSITDTFGGQSFSPYTEVVFVEGLFCTQTVHLGPGLYTVVVFSSRVASKRGFHLYVCCEKQIPVILIMMILKPHYINHPVVH